MQVIGDVAHLEPRLGKLPQREIKQWPVVRLEMELARLFQQLTVLLQEPYMREAALRMTLFRPGIAEIDIESVYLIRRENRRDFVDVKDEQTHVLELKLGDFLCG